MHNFKPMLASPVEFELLTFPVYVSPKIDGIRASVVDGRLLSRTLKEIPNRHIYNALNFAKYSGLDGELVVGDPTSHTCYRDAVSGVMSDGGSPDFTYYVFDKWNLGTLFYDRIHTLKTLVGTRLWHPRFTLVNHRVVRDERELLAYETEQLKLGFEGIMINRHDAFYKHGRATARGGELLKLKRFVDSEAEVIGAEEEMFNGNDAETNELGRTKRSTAKAGLVGKGTMGALMVRDLVSKVEFNIGTGFTADERKEWWQWFLTQDVYTPKPIIKYKSFQIGVKDKPRHPVYLGRRPKGA